MTLTEEQREAIRVISKLPMAIGCQLCHPYIMENYGSHFIVLRDMIDSSGTVEPTGGFDLEKARADMDAANVPADGYYDANARIVKIHMPGALAEIERLQSLRSDIITVINRPKTTSDKGLLMYIRDEVDINMRQAAKIQELETDMKQSERVIEAKLDVIDWQAEEIKRLKDELENYGDHYACLLISKDAQIKELEGMLSIRTEELDIAHSVARSEKEMHEKELAAFARRIKELEGTLAEIRNLIPALIGPHGLAHYCAEQKVAKLVAYDKIGPDAETGNRDHVVGPDQMVPNGKVWQITEERKTMLSHCLEVVDYVATTKAYSDAIRDRDTIRAMLEENL